MINGDMQINRLCLFAILSFPPLLGCGLEQTAREVQRPSAKVAEEAPVLHLDHAQPRLPTMRRFLADKTVTAHDMEPLDESSIPAQSANVQFVLEMPQGWFKKQGIQVGTMIVSEKGPLKQVLVGR